MSKRLAPLLFVLAVVTCVYNLGLSWSGNVTWVPALVGLGMAMLCVLLFVALWRFG
jgi:hypothetical protein